MPTRAVRSNEATPIGDADAAFAAAWRFACMGHPDALAAFESAWHAAAERTELQAEVAASAIVFTHLQFTTYAELPRWTQRMALHGAGTAGPMPAAASLVPAIRGLATVPEGSAEVEARIADVRAVEDPDCALAAAIVVHEFADLFAEDRDYVRVEAAGSRVEPRASPFLRFAWWCGRAQHAFHRARYDEAQALYERAAEFVDVPESFTTRRDLLCDLAQLALGRGDVAAAGAMLEEIGPADLARPAARSAFAEILRARVAALEGRFEAAKRHARLAEAIGREVAYNAFPMCLQVEAQAMTAIGEGDLAGDRLERHLDDFHGEQRDIVRTFSGLCRGYAMWRRGDQDAARAILEPAFVDARRLEFITFFRYTPGVAAELAAAALCWGVERDWVRHVIRQRGLPAPASVPDDWPWPVRIRGLGDFAVEVDGVALDATRKGQGKPLEVLTAIVALDGRRVPQDKLLAAVWRGRGRVGTENVWYVTLRRLRDMLGLDNAVAVGQQRVSLAGGLVDLDLWRLEEALGAAAARPADPAAMEAVVAAYTGPLLAGCALPVAVDARQKLRGSVAAFAARAAGHLARAEAASLGRRLRLADPELPLLDPRVGA